MKGAILEEEDDFATRMRHTRPHALVVRCTVIERFSNYRIMHVEW